MTGVEPDPGPGERGRPPSFVSVPAVDDCGAGDGVNCLEVLESVYVYLDGEAGDERASLVRHHLDECVACLRAYGLEREVKLLVARCCGSDRAPDELRAKVLTRIRTVRLDIERVDLRVE